MTYGPWKRHTRVATCGALQPKGKGRYRLACSERPGHCTPHIARGMDGKQLARWTNKGERRAA